MDYICECRLSQISRELSGPAERVNVRKVWTTPIECPSLKIASGSRLTL
jgi:hypothetical protein